MGQKLRLLHVLNEHIQASDSESTSALLVFQDHWSVWLSSYFLISSVVLSLTPFLCRRVWSGTKSCYVDYILLQELFFSVTPFLKPFGFGNSFWNRGLLVVVVLSLREDCLFSKQRTPTFLTTLFCDSCCQQGFVSQALAQRSSHRNSQCEAA